VLIIQYYWGIDSVYSTDDIEKYGRITANFDNDTPKDIIFSFFPEEISESFKNVSYHYSAKKGDIYAFECYLEFTIEDKAEFEDTLQSLMEFDQVNTFEYDKNYMEYRINDQYDVDWDSYYECSGYPIRYAKVRKILFDSKKQHLVFWALGVLDGAGAKTDEFDHFFGKFEIDPFDYQLSAYVTSLDEEKGITYEELMK